MDSEVHLDYLLQGIHLMQRRLGDTIHVGHGQVCSSLYLEIWNDTVTFNGEALKELYHVLWQWHEESNGGSVSLNWSTLS